MKDIKNTVDYQPVMGVLSVCKSVSSYFIFDQPALLKLQTKIYPASAGQSLTTLSSWIVKYVRSVGEHWIPQLPPYQSPFYSGPAFSMGDYIVPSGGWKTFSKFFAREVKPAMHPSASLGDLGLVISPTDPHLWRSQLSSTAVFWIWGQKCLRNMQLH